MSVIDHYLELWTVYEGASDVPDARYCARLSLIGNHGEIIATNKLFKGDTLDAVRIQFNKGDIYTRLPRAQLDQPHIVEVWL